MYVLFVGVPITTMREIEAYQKIVSSKKIHSKARRFGTWKVGSNLRFGKVFADKKCNFRNIR